ncbi:MAG: glutaminase [Alphaproteobacteria bacterium]|nr:glutaminase [Alphaproteobacteria bacterium]
MDLAKIINEIVHEIKPELGVGKVADYIPALAKADPKKFGIAVTTVIGETFSAGDAKVPFSIQSVSKLFTLTLALREVGDQLWKRLGREPSGNPFNSLVQLEREGGVPRNPFINAGAIVVADVIVSAAKHARHNDPAGNILQFVQTLADDPKVRIDRMIAKSEADTGFRNVALANFMKSFGNIENEPELVLETYFKQCAIEMNCVDLSRAALYLANFGRDPLTGDRIIRSDAATRINAIMMTCGHYDASGEFAFRVGLPGKSGVGGGIVVVVPGKMTAAVWSPGLNKHGNSHAGTVALELFAAKSKLSLFGATGRKH